MYVVLDVLLLLIYHSFRTRAWWTVREARKLEDASIRCSLPESTVSMWICLLYLRSSPVSVEEQ